MKKIPYILIISFCLLFFLPTFVIAEEAPLPGINCGLTTDNTNKCCIANYQVREDADPGWIEKIADFLGVQFLVRIRGTERKLKSNMKEFQDVNAYNKPCLAGGTPEYINDPDTGQMISCTCVPEQLGNVGEHIEKKMCKRYFSVTEPDQLAEREQCKLCAQSQGYWSSFGCVPLNISAFVSQFVLNIGIGLGGLFAFICIVYNSLKLQLSRGDSTKLQAIRENITSCILGLVLILFSVVILRIADITILGGLLGN